MKKLPPYGSDVVVGIGDDAAVIKMDKGRYLLATCDSLVEDVHFKSELITPEQLGRKLVAINVSDIAAMGGVPKHLLVSLVIPKNTPDQFVDRLYNGISKACKKYGVGVIGGNMSRGEKLVIDGFLIGEVDQKQLVTRKGAKAGDVVLLTGALGKRGKVPTARVAQGRIIATYATAMIDISDGLSSDLSHICEESSVGVRIFSEKLTLALHSGEEYELCFTAKPKDAAAIIKAVEEKTGTKVTVIGEIIDKKEGCWIVNKQGKKTKLKKEGWDHFS